MSEFDFKAVFNRVVPVVERRHGIEVTTRFAVALELLTLPRAVRGSITAGW